MASINTPQARYSTVAMILHWTLAVLILVNWQLAEMSHGLEGAAEAAYMNPHKAIGITVIFLTIVRIIWRLMNPPPPMDPAYAPWERMLAKTVHALFYIILISMPLLGWLAVSSFGRGVDMFGIFTMPALPVANDPDAGKWVIELHEAIWTPFVILIALHVLGALKHQFIDKNGELGRMIPGLGKR